MIIKVKVKPNSSKSEFLEKEKIAFLKSKPKENKANLELMKLLAKYFNIPTSRIKIKFGKKSREKIVEIGLK